MNQSNSKYKLCNFSVPLHILTISWNSDKVFIVQQISTLTFIPYSCYFTALKPQFFKFILVFNKTIKTAKHDKLQNKTTFNWKKRKNRKTIFFIFFILYPHVLCLCSSLYHSIAHILITIKMGNFPFVFSIFLHLLQQLKNCWNVKGVACMTKMIWCLMFAYLNVVGAKKKP